MVKNLLASAGDAVQSLGQEDSLEKEMTTHPSTLAWEIPWTEETGRVQSMGCKESDTTEHMHIELVAQALNATLTALGIK